MLSGFYGSAVIARNAPVTTAGSASLCQPGSFSIPITVDNFTNISGISLRLDYDPAVITFTGFTANSELGTMIVNNVPVSGSLHKIMIVWAETTPKTFPNGTALVTLTFNYLAGTTSLTFNNTANNGGDCEYADENGDPMTDNPTELFYKNGTIQSIPAILSLTNITIGSGQNSTFRALQSITTAGSGTSFSIQNGGVSSFIAGQHVTLLPGTQVAAGGVLHTTISDPCVLPTNSENSLISASQDEMNPKAEIQGEERPMITLYPNPTDGMVTIEKRMAKQGESMFLDIYDMKGNSVIRTDLSGEPIHIISLEEKPAGIYLISVITNETTQTFRLLKR